MKVSKKTLFSTFIFMKVVSLIFLLASSALPVKSNAFSITNGLDAGSLAHSTSRRHEAFQRQGNAALFVTVDALNESIMIDGPSSKAFNVISLRGGDTTTLSIIDKSKAFISKNFFLVGMVVAVSFAKLFPEVCQCICFTH